MIIRNKEGKLIHISQKDYLNEKDFYHALWNNKYNIQMSKTEKETKVLEYLKSKIFSN